MATEVNASGDVAGELYHESDIGRSPFSGQRIHAFFWHSGKMEEIKPLPGGQYIQPTGMNDAGQVVGWSYSILSQHDPAHPNSFSVPATAFLWQDEKTYNLQQFLPATTDLRLQCADGINNRGQIIATAYQSNRTWGQRTVLLTPN